MTDAGRGATVESLRLVMIGRFRTTSVVVAALALVAAAPTGARVDAGRANVTLQVVPRGHGSVRGGAEVGGLTCSTNSGSGSCAWTAPAGTRVTLTALPDAGASPVIWSVSDCAAGATTCTFTLDEDTTATAIFGPLHLRVLTSGGEAGLVTSQPAGINCPGDCDEDFAPGTLVTLTTRSTTGATFTRYRFGCEETSGATCTVHVWDEPTTVGVEFNNVGGPDKPAVPSIKIRIAKQGNGTGTVTAGALNCGGTCTASFDYGTLVTFVADVTGGSVFGGWGGLCAATAHTCSLAAGPFTLIRPRFDRDAPPGAPGAPRATSATATAIAVEWSAASDDRGIAAYEVYVGDEAKPRVSPTTTSAQLTGLACGKTYTVGVVAVDTGGNRSDRATADLSTAPCALRVDRLGASVTRTRVVCGFRASAAGAGTAALYVRNRRSATRRVTFAAGTNAIAFPVPRAARGARLRVTLTVGAKTWTWTVTAKR